MAGKRLGVAHVDQAFDDAQRVVETLCAFKSAAHAEREKRATDAAKVFLRQRVLRAIVKASIIHPIDPWIVAKKFCNFVRILDVALDAERNSFDALEEQEGIERGEN